MCDQIVQSVSEGVVENIGEACFRVSGESRALQRCFPQACLYNATEAVSLPKTLHATDTRAEFSDHTAAPAPQIAKIDMFAGFAEICQGEHYSTTM